MNLKLLLTVLLLADVSAVRAETNIPTVLPGSQPPVSDVNPALAAAATRGGELGVSAFQNNPAGVQINLGAPFALSVTPVGNSAPARATFAIQGKSVAGNTRQFMTTLGLLSDTGNACAGPQCGNVTQYVSLDQQAGSADAWAQNILVNAGPGVSKYLQAIEVDVDNKRGDTPLGTGNFVGGITVTGTNAAAHYLNRHALMVSSGSPNALWHVGLLGDANSATPSRGPSVVDALVYDQGAGGTYSYWNSSSHTGAMLFDQGASPVGAALSGAYSRAAVSTENAKAPIALAAAAGQKVCFAGVHACGSYDSAAGKWIFTDEHDTVLFSVARATGNAVFKGSVTQNGTP